MRLLHFVCFYWLLTLLSFPVRSQSLVVSNVTLITPDAAGRVVTLKNHWVEINGERIATISPTPLKPGKDDQIVNGEGKYLIPGLMDSHVHTQSMPGIDWSKPELQPLQDAFMRQQPRSYLYYGVTQVLDPSLSVQAVEAFDQAPLHPNMLFCGSAPIIGGYNLLGASFEEAIARRPYFIHRPETDGELPTGFTPENHTPEAVVERMKRDGAHCVKVFIEDGFGAASDWPMISMELLLRVRKAADKHGLKVMAHANALDMQELALAAEVDIMAHGMWNWLGEKAPVEDGKKQLPLKIKDIADGIMVTDTAYQPTINVMRALRDVNVAGHLDHPAYKDVVPQQILDWYHTEDGQWFAREMRQGWGTNDLSKITGRQSHILQQGEQVLQYLYEQGHPVLLATDTPPAPTFSSQPGLSTYWEMQAMAKLGIDLPELLKAATINNTITFGIQKDYGSVETGKIANLLLLNDNPLKTIEAYDNIDSVILGGKLIPRETLKAN